jgi:hypothetical protein
MLRTSAAHRPQVSSRDRIGGKYCGGSLAGTKAGCDYRIASADLQLVSIRNVRASELGEKIACPLNRFYR